VTRPRVALTFDTEHPDRPTEPDVTPRLLDALAGLDVAATFFVQARWAEAYPAMARRIVDAGHLVGSHSFYHARMTLFSADGFADDVRRAGAVIEEILGLDPRPWFRLPFGDGADDPDVHRRLEELGYRHVHWHADPEDWENGATGPAVEECLVSRALAYGDGAVLLLHAWPVPALEALPGTVARLRAAGMDLVRLDALDAWPAHDP
jgi:peptidoglycan/xylan/chitin deacetylase (PgdA/CDA1 family)